MKLFKRAAAGFMATIMMVLVLPGQAIFGNTFSDDVPPEHWAFQSVSVVTSLGLMQGLTVDRFGVNELIGLFETSRILANLGGFRSHGATEAEQAFFEYVYNKHWPTINEYAQHFANWRHEYNREIAFLLELGVFSPPDLGNFFLIYQGTERLKALLRFEIAVFLARVLGVGDLARTFVPSPNDLFADDADIPPANKPYVYFMRHLGIISGDGANNFVPGGPVTRAAMAVLLHQMVDLMNETDTPAGLPQQTQGNFEAFSGEVTQVHAVFRAIEVLNAFTGERRIFPIRTDANIAINQLPAFFEGLRVGMEVAGVLVNNEVIDLAALSHSAPQNIPPQQSIVTPDLSVMSDAVIEGIVVGTRIVNELPYVDVLVRLLNTLGEVVEETRTFLIGGPVIRGIVPVDFWNINPGDVATLTITGTTAFQINLEEQFRTIVGTVVGKRTVPATGMGVFSVQDMSGRIHDLVTTDTSAITRFGHTGSPSWRDVRLGDAVEISAEFNQIISINATGVRSFLDVLVTRIVIATGYAELTGVNDGVEMTFPIIPNIGVNPYAIRIGSTVRLGLDSREIEDIITLEAARSSDITGMIVNIVPTTGGVSRLNLRNAADPLDARSFTLDEGTIIVDAATGNRLSMASLVPNMRVYVVFDHTRDNYITNLTILGF